MANFKFTEDDFVETNEPVVTQNQEVPVQRLEFTEQDFAPTPTREPDIRDIIGPTFLAERGDLRKGLPAFIRGRGQAAFEPGQRNIVGNIFERPASALRGALRGVRDTPGTPQQKINAALQRFQTGATLPETEPRFEPSERFVAAGAEALQFMPGFTGLPRDTRKGIARAIESEAVNLATNPADVALTIGLGGKVLKEGIKLSGVAGQRIAKTLSRFQTDFINESAFPRVSKLFLDKVNKFTPDIKRFAKNKFKASQDVVDYIQQRTPDTIKKTADFFNNSLDDLVVRLKGSMETKSTQIRKFYDEALSRLKDDDLIPIDQAFNSTRKFLKKHGFIDELDNFTSLSQAPTANPKIKAVSDFFKFLSQRRGAGTTAVSRKDIGGVNKAIWQDFREIISNSTVKGGKDRITKEIVKISDALHNQASKSGLKGIDVARKQQAKFFQHEEILRNVDTSGKLSNSLGKSKVQKSLKELDTYLDANFKSGANDITARRVLDKVEDIGRVDAGTGQSILRTNLSKLADKTQAESIKRDFFVDLLGRDKELLNVFSDISKFNRNTLIKRVGGIAGGVGVGGTIGGVLLKKSISRALKESGQTNISEPQ